MKPVTLASAHAILEPLSPDHIEAATEAVRDGELWRLWYTSIPAPDTMKDEINRRLRLQTQGDMLPFIVRNSAGRVVGMTSFMNIDAINKRLEIGSTWYAKSAQRTVLNTACKRLLLGHAFESLTCIAVEFRTHFLNQASRRAIERLGAKLDGVLRNHSVMANGTLRDTAVYSVTQSEWPAVRANLEFRLEMGRLPQQG